MNLKRILVLMAISTTIGGCFWADTYSSKAFDYEAAIYNVSSLSSRHADTLRECLGRWGYKKDLREQLYISFLKDVRSDDAAMVVEFGGSSTVQYDYIYISNGNLRSSIVPSIELSVKSLRLVDLGEDGIRNIFNEIAPNVEENVVDGGCHFVSIAYKGEVKQVAMYDRRVTGSKSEGWLENLIKELVLRGRATEE